MPPTLVLIRHAEAEHNATENWNLRDPLLTPDGIQQCEILHTHLQEQAVAADIEHIVTSPLRRTLQTTLVALDWLIQKGVPVECNAMWQENSDSPCDTGSDLETIATEFPQLDFSQVDPIFPNKSIDTPYAFTRSANEARGQACLAKLYDQPEKAIAVVSHSAFLRTAISRGRRYANADYRIFKFRRSKNGYLSLVEDSVTAQRGGGMARSLKGLYGIEKWDLPNEEIIASAGDNRTEHTKLG